MNEPKSLPKCKLIGADGNVFNLIGKASKALKKAGHIKEAKELSEKVFSCGSYDEALNLISEYVEVY